MSPRIFLILPAALPFALDVTLTLAGQPSEYWNGAYDQAAEMAPVGRTILSYHPLAFVAASAGYAALFSLAIRLLPAWIALWISLGYLIAHTSGANSWLVYQDVRLEAIHNVAISGVAALCYSLYFRRSQVQRMNAEASSTASLSATLPLIACVVLFVGCWGGASSPPSALPVTRMPGVEVVDEPPAVDLAKDWPWWRGPAGNNVARCETAPTTWDERTNVIWNVPVPGRGHASPTVCGDGVYLATADEANQRQIVVAYDRATGEERWQKVVHEGGFAGHAHDKNTQANSTIACDGERLFAAFLHDDEIWLYALDLAGEVVWSTKAGDFAPQFGYAPSPAIYGSAVLVALDSLAGGRLVAIDRRSGDVAWIAERAGWASYSSPAVGKIAGQDQIVLTGGKAMISYHPQTGEELWRVAGLPETTCGTPTFDGERVYASGGQPEHITMAVSGSGILVWSNKDRIYEPSLLATKGLVFAVTDDGIAICRDAATGEERWKARLEGNFSASPVECGGNVYAANDRGKTFVFEATGEEYREVAANQFGTDAYATPLICDSRIYLRVGDDSSGIRQERLVCIGE